MSEPIAWINVEKRQLEWAKNISWDTPTVVKLDKIPLYTHPMRELTDEEIMIIHDATNTNNWVIDFARAIIKASRGEK